MVCPATGEVGGAMKEHVTSVWSLRSMPGVVNLNDPVVTSKALFTTKFPVPFTTWRAAPCVGIFAVSKLDGVPAGPVQSKSVIVTDPSLAGSAWAAPAAAMVDTAMSASTSDDRISQNPPDPLRCPCPRRTLREGDRESNTLVAAVYRSTRGECGRVWSWGQSPKYDLGWRRVHRPEGAAVGGHHRRRERSGPSLESPRRCPHLIAADVHAGDDL